MQEHRRRVCTRAHSCFLCARFDESFGRHAERPPPFGSENQQNPRARVPTKISRLPLPPISLTLSLSLFHPLHQRSLPYSRRFIARAVNVTSPKRNRTLAYLLLRLLRQARNSWPARRAVDSLAGVHLPSSRSLSFSISVRWWTPI